MDTKIIFYIIGFVVLISIIGGTTSTIYDAGEEATYANNNCSETTDVHLGTTLTLNTSDLWCWNSSGSGGNRLHPADITYLPLQTMFSPTGVVLLVVVASLLIGLIVYLNKVRQ